MALVVEETPGPVLSAINLGYAYTSKGFALRGVDFFVRAGEAVGILGKNGAGKTTLIRALSGLLTPNQGEVWLKDRPLQSYKNSELYRTLGLVFQNPNDQVVEFRVLDDVLFGPKNLGVDPIKAKGRALNALKRVGLEGFEERLVRTLSFGEMKRLSIAGLLAMDPSVLILDEPTQGLDPAGEVAVMRILKKLAKSSNIAVVVTTHNLDLAASFLDRVYLLDKGQVLAEGPSDSLLRDEGLLKKANLRLPYMGKPFSSLKRQKGLSWPEVPVTLKQARAFLKWLFSSSSNPSGASRSTAGEKGSAQSQA